MENDETYTTASFTPRPDCPFLKAQMAILGLEEPEGMDSGYADPTIVPLDSYPQDG